jgi:hypothetical protein
MGSLIGFAVGFVAGWAARSTVESSRAAAVRIASTVVEMVERAKRAAAIESDYLEDFVAEVRSRVDEGHLWRSGRGPVKDTADGRAGGFAPDGRVSADGVRAGDRSAP